MIIYAGIQLIGSLIGSAKQKKQQRKALGAIEENRTFNRERYATYKKIYGGLQEDLGEYYNNMTGATLASKDREKIELAGQQSASKIQETLAQRGISGSGLEGQLIAGNTLSTEIAKAQATSDADEKVAQRKSEFLSIGLQQEQNIANNLSNNATSMANIYTKSGKQKAGATGDMTGSMMGMAKAVMQ